MLTVPPNESAFDLYQSVLRRRPESADARRGIMAIQDTLLTRAREAIASEDLPATAALLDEAARAGAPATVIATLRREAAHGQELLDAKLGKPGSLYPLAALRAISREPPVYPDDAPPGTGTSLELQLTVAEDGSVGDIDVVDGAPGYFVREARRAVRQWRFEPVLHDGNPVAVRTSVRLTFRP